MASNILSLKTLQPASSAAANCTHMTVTRLYTTVHICSVCRKTAASGWLYRCTQDRELMLEHDLKYGKGDKLDELCDFLPRSTDMKKWSAEARENPLSLQSEMSEEQFKSYTPEQLGKLLQQRTHVQTILAKSSPKPSHTLLEKLSIPNPFASASPTQPTDLPTNPWLPDTECQYKVCASCRPSFRERSFLSLNAIANGDIPATATLGFGFHLGGGRRIAKHEVVKSIGLRSTEKGDGAEQGKGQKLKLRKKAKFGSALERDGDYVMSGSALSVLALPDEASGTSSSISSFSDVEIQGERDMTILSPTRRENRGATSQEHRTPPAATAVTGTAMEIAEATTHSFTSDPLDVKGGVAVMEESVELHVADLITRR